MAGNREATVKKWELSDSRAGSVDASDAIAHYDNLFVTHYDNILIV
jgi:hypothetical protein